MKAILVFLTLNYNREDEVLHLQVLEKKYLFMFINVSQLVIYLLYGHLSRGACARTDPCPVPHIWSIRVSESAAQGAAF